MSDSTNTPSGRPAGDSRRKTSRAEARRRRRRDLAALAEEVSQTHCPTGLVDPRLIADAKRITYSFGAYGDAFDGMLEYRSGRFHIYCNLVRLGAEDSPRARFTMAHELGHYFIDEHRNALVSQRVGPHPSLCDFESSLLAEEETDHFAANLLMPERRFRRAVAGASRGLEGILALSRGFGTSITSCAVRCASVNAFPCAFVKWNWKRHGWRCFSRSMLRGRFRRIYKTPGRHPLDSPTRLALAQKEPPEGGFFRGGTLASMWFPYVKPDDPLDVILVEEAIPLGRYGALTVLYPPLDCPVFGSGLRVDKRSR
ncbi:MAG: ImmA/IrrE family metallo-endopeptidase [Lentisphaerae bacterium]|jgi:hypothetical protein|nr:ImmA/IrrE family metallo-endopeptidase [Lentisphaerota bacterium]MBT4814864.1 ImmA/IrrE family metallo-endopeptidase [Lentisphaerota bacterium]MBT5611978.1 ImmA/IrrE family metallo-endopeptidase [Lentisphaerota bacterium]MBT7060898.1 ImmA/IrrE family metallo-endopeptidase [Lentisphaerota bacterium]MBT7847737.1 ImmA/IrrE family metallo-endopeptidase [Lentisphaerota bacterium]